MNRTSRDEGGHTSCHINRELLYDRGTIKVVVFACIIIVLSVMLTGVMSYYITRNAVVEKLKTRDLIYIIESISSKIDGRIERAKETSLLLAQDPAIIQWIRSGEQDERLGKYAQQKINDISQHYDYANSFIVSAITNHYWAEGFKLIQVMSPVDPNSQWFYAALASGKAVNLNLDYNSGRQDTFVFLNALVGNVEHPIGVAGVGLSLKEIAREFQNYKLGEESNLWLIDRNGKIYLSDNLAHNGNYLNDFVPENVVSQVIKDNGALSSSPRIIEYVNPAGETVDLAYQTTKATDWKLVFQIPRKESIALLGNIKLNTMVASLIALLLMIVVFYLVSRRIANPLKRALLITAEMEKQVHDRTRELAEKNQKIIDSIDYAKRLQESILATEEEIRAVFHDYFILWQPRDIVGGDFYWLRRIDADRSFIALADCTGHGVPGAFMTMAVNTILNHIIDQHYTEPADILAELNRRIKETLHQNSSGQMTDDGLDIGICRIDNHKQLLFAGAKISLYINRQNQVTRIKADNKSIGYRRSSSELAFTNHSWEIEAGDQFYLTTDGYLDQNGGEKDYPFGRKRFVETIATQDEQVMSQQGKAFETVLADYMGNESQRDDITVVGFSLGR
ncbi:SpoIIE family protein phosphatase [Sporomusa acidovorans]|uniref:PPM-type phosphatase domain-containing protein n=1 Tax=Sporomusa acidovorans (strain ATCC 49682 / DSM 3132 / Mol) TaxID=1123286 RepID=A0ABZ3IWU9_SPOA4|nr:SpoIIE family protein phosphatase [Sporomusa acidovorans]OZC24046.1 stage II sporulation protein SpoIIE [Sporomusa acidovorans DSM 3132]SDF58030.1 Serine phosphatase RsbU, regulator of sigma subunit [Sporomusa acidovorans]